MRCQTRFLLTIRSVEGQNSRSDLRRSRSSSHRRAKAPWSFREFPGQQSRAQPVLNQQSRNEPLEPNPRHAAPHRRRPRSGPRIDHSKGRRQFERFSRGAEKDESGAGNKRRIRNRPPGVQSFQIPKAAPTAIAKRQAEVVCSEIYAVLPVPSQAMAEKREQSRGAESCARLHFDPSFPRRRTWRLEGGCHRVTFHQFRISTANRLGGGDRRLRIY